MMHHYKVSCTRDNLKLIREFVRVVLQNYELSEVEVNQLILAVDEICANLIIHAHKCDPKESIELDIHDHQGQVVFEIINKDGDDYDLNNYQDPSLPKMVEERRKGGLGLMLVHKIMDKVDVLVQDSRCTWRLIKNLQPKPRSS